MSNETFKDDIESAERKLLIFSWVGVVASISLVAFSIWGI